MFMIILISCHYLYLTNGGKNPLKNYDLLCVIKTNLDIDSVEQVIKNIEESIKNFGGNVLNTDKTGEKNWPTLLTVFETDFMYTVLNSLKLK